jgi:homeobox protein cut-like
MREAKTQSIAGKKMLNDLTKSFRTLSPPEQLNGINDLLRAYQKEIDQLNARAKLGEAAFFALYKAIYEAPDPTPAMNALSASIMEVSVHQLEIEKLKNEISQYDEEFRQLKNQDITIRRLEDQLTEFKERIDDKVSDEVAKRVQEIEESAEIRIVEIKTAQYTAEKRLAASLEELAEARSIADRCQSQLFDISAQAEKQLSAIQAENSILGDDIDRLRSRNAELERDLDISLKKLAANGGHGNTLSVGVSQGVLKSAGSSDATTDGAIGDNEASDVRMLMDELRRELRKKEDDLRTDKAKSDAIQRDLTLQLSLERENVQNLTKELNVRPTIEEVESLKRQLRTLQRIAFNIQEDDEVHMTRNLYRIILLILDFQEIGDSDQMVEDEQLEAILLTRMKGLESELAESRNSVIDLRKREVFLPSLQCI